MNADSNPTDDTPQRPAIKTISEIVPHFWEHVEAEDDPMPTGIVCLDDKVGGGLKPKRLYTLLGGPGSGKTTLAQQIGEHIAAQEHPVVFVSLEEDIWALLAKSISRVADLDYGAVLHEPEEHRPAIESALQTISERDQKHLLAYIEDDCLLSLDSLRTIAQQHFAQCPDKNGLIVMDYLQRWARDARSEDTMSRRDMREVVGFLLERLRRLAKDLNCAVLLLSSQNTRSTGYKPAKDTVLGSAKESGDIEYGGDVVMAIGPDEEPRRPVPLGWAAYTLYIAKNRLGPNNVALPLDWCGSRQKMRDASPTSKDTGTGSSSTSDNAPPLRRKTSKRPNTKEDREFDEHGHETKRPA
jgi:replicative DNA helicase